MYRGKPPRPKANVSEALNPKTLNNLPVEGLTKKKSYQGPLKFRGPWYDFSFL